MVEKKKIIVLIGITLTLIIMAFLIKDFVESWNNIKPYLAVIRLNWFVLAVITYVVAFILTGNNWAYLVWLIESNVQRVDLLNIHVTSAVARYIPGGIWNILSKAYLCSKRGVGRSTTTASIILEYVFQIVSSGLFLIVFLLLKTYNNVFLAETYIIAILVSVLLLLIPSSIKLGTKMICKIFRENDNNIVLDKKIVYIVILRYTLVWITTGFSFIFLAKAFTEINILQGIYLILSYPLSWCLGFLSPSPNGIGVREAMLGFLLSSSYNHDFVLLLAIASRFLTILGEVIAFTVFKIIFHCLKRVKINNRADKV